MRWAEIADVLAVSSHRPAAPMFRAGLSSSPSSGMPGLMSARTPAGPFTVFGCVYDPLKHGRPGNGFFDASASISAVLRPFLTSATRCPPQPDNCDGTYEQYCDKTREYSNIREILTSKGETKMVEYFDTHWKSNTDDDESLWSHEWDKHGAFSPLTGLDVVVSQADKFLGTAGTCMSTLETQCYGRRYQQYDEVVDYFERTYDQYRKLPTYDWLAAEGIVPSLAETYTLAQLQAAAQKKFGHKIFWGCVDRCCLDGGLLGSCWKDPLNPVSSPPPDHLSTPLVSRHAAALTRASSTRRGTTTR